MIPEKQHPGLKVQDWFDKFQATDEKTNVPEKDKKAKRRKKARSKDK